MIRFAKTQAGLEIYNKSSIHMSCKSNHIRLEEVIADSTVHWRNIGSCANSASKKDVVTKLLH